MIRENNSETAILEAFEEFDMQIPLQKLFDEMLVFVAKTVFES